MPLPPGTRLGPYEILSPVGAGGMGEVYRARDERLGRSVAVKVLPSDVSRDAERLARFDREAKALAALSHPNILAIHDVGTQNGTAYLVTELLEGESLRQRIQRERLSWRRCVEIAAAVADGLAAAHAKGIFHRDIKPENVFVTEDGRVKVLDFGLARVESPRAAAPETVTISNAETALGTVMGTMGYIAPEQLRGVPADGRSDIFTLGCLLYEMLTSQRCFARETAAETMAAILKDPAPEVSLSGVAASVELNRLVARCLEKRAVERFQSASDLAFHLRSLLSSFSSASVTSGRAEAAVNAGVHSIAVLPFANLSSDREQEFFCDGMTEEIITALSQLRGLRVISRNSVMTLKGTQKTSREIGDLLHVGHLLNGTVRRAGNNLRIGAQLIDAATDGNLWAARYAGTLDDVFDIQEKVARAIADAMQVTLSPNEQQHLAEHAATDARVLECSQRAWQEMQRASRESLERALRFLQHGMETLGEHPLFYVGLARAHFYAIEFDLEAREEALRSAAEYMRRLAAFDPRYSYALVGKQQRVAGNVTQALRHFEDAVAANPADVDSLVFLSFGYSFHAGKGAAGAAVAERLISVDPLSAINLLGRAGAFWADADFAQAVAVLDELHRRDPGIGWSEFLRTHLLGALGKVEEACRLAVELATDPAYATFAPLASGVRHALLGEREALVATISGDFALYCWNDPELPELVAGWFAWVGETGRALEWIERFVERGAINYPLLAHGDPYLQSLRGEPRFQRLLDRIRHEWERFEARFRLGGS